MKEIKVSKDFVDIYLNFNVKDVTNEMRKLSQKELFLLLTFCLDKHDDEIPTVIANFKPFKDEIMEIFDILDDKSTTNKYLQQLIKWTYDDYIETDNVVDQNGDKLPKPYTKAEIRNKKINFITD
jgi:hypothetical protein